MRHPRPWCCARCSKASGCAPKRLRRCAVPTRARLHKVPVHIRITALANGTPFKRGDQHIALTRCLHPTKRPRISCTCKGCGDCERNALLQITPIQYQDQSTPVNSGLSPHWEQRLAYAHAQRRSPVVTAANVAQRLLRKHTLTSVRALFCPQGLVSPSARCSLPALVAACTLPHPRVATERAANARIADGRPATAWD